MRVNLVSLVLFFTLVGVGNALADVTSNRDSARELIHEGRWEDAVKAYSQLVVSNPYRGTDWHFLGVAYARAGNCTAAQSAFVRAVELGSGGYNWDLRDTHIEAAACDVALGELNSALDHLSIAQARFKLSDFDTLRNDPRFSNLVREARFARLSGSGGPPGIGRVEGWSADIDRYVDLIERWHPNPFNSINEQTWRRAVTELRDNISDLSDLQIIGRFMRMASMIGDGHTTIYPPFQGPNAFHLVPIWPYAFGDEWRIVAAAPEYSDLVGTRIVKAGGVPMVEATSRIAAYLPRDNEMTSKWLVNVGLQFAEISAVVSNSPENCCLQIEVETASGTRRSVTLQGTAIDRDPMARWTPGGWPSAIPAEAPLWLSNLQSNFWFQEINDLDALYVQINQVRNNDDQSYEDFAEDFVAQIDSKGLRRLILDLRHNNGGNGYLNWPLVRAIIRTEAVDRPDGLFVITGRRTFSAAMILASMLEFHTHAIFVGEPTGSRPQFFGEDTPFTLPYSGLQGSISSLFFQNRFASDDHRPWIAPDLHAPLTWDDLTAGRDPALVAIRGYLDSKPE